MVFDHFKRRVLFGKPISKRTSTVADHNGSTVSAHGGGTRGAVGERPTEKPYNSFVFWPGKPVAHISFSSGDVIVAPSGTTFTAATVTSVIRVLPPPPLGFLRHFPGKYYSLTPTPPPPFFSALPRISCLPLRLRSRGAVGSSGKRYTRFIDSRGPAPRARENATRSSSARHHLSRRRRSGRDALFPSLSKRHAFAARRRRPAQTHTWFDRLDRSPTNWTVSTNVPAAGRPAQDFGQTRRKTCTYTHQNRSGRPPPSGV